MSALPTQESKVAPKPAPKPAAKQDAKQEAKPAFEFAFSPDEFRRIADILYADAGIALSDQKMPLVYGRLVKRLRALGLESFKEYCALLGSRAGLDERQAMMAALTTNVTRFMREPHHFEHLARVFLPPLLRGAARGERVRVWSAGCSSGQEPYSIGLTILGLMPDAADHDVRILASDIDPNMVATGRRGVYSDEEAAEISRNDKARWFEREAAGADDGGKWKAGAALRRLVAFRELNLIGQWPMRGRFDAIFCRNVVIYFDEATQRTIWSRYAEALRPGGLLCIGHSERLSGPANAVFRLIGPTMFQRTDNVAS